MNLSTLCAAICSLAITVTSAIPSSYSGPAASSDSSSVPNLKVYVILYKGQPSEPSEQSAVRATKDKAEAFLEGKGGVVVQNYDLNPGFAIALPPGALEEFRLTAKDYGPHEPIIEEDSNFTIMMK